jgi:hypothetical protein
MKVCDTCKWADDEGQPDGIAVCRAGPPTSNLMPNGSLVSIWPRINLLHDYCKQHEEGRSKIRLVQDMPGKN